MTCVMKACAVFEDSCVIVVGASTSEDRHSVWIVVSEIAERQESIFQSW